MYVCVISLSISVSLSKSLSKPPSLNLSTTQAHDDLVRVYKAKLVKLGIPASELEDVEALLGQTSTAPADLIA